MITVCIPTHHGRARQLTEALGSVAREIEVLPPGSVEVVVSDNGSHDDTAEVLAAFKQRLGGALVTRRFDENVGFTRNLLQAVETASGSFCWLLGSDDAIAPGGLAEVCGLVAADPDLTGLTVNQVQVGSALEPLEHAPRGGRTDPRVLPTAGHELFTETTTALTELGLLQDFISTQIVRRDRWMQAVDRLGEQGMALGKEFPHLPVLIEMIETCPRWRWVPEPLVLHRTGRQTLGAFGQDIASHAILCIGQRADIWAARFGEESDLYRSLMLRAYEMQGGPLSIAHYKSDPSHSPAVSLQLFRELSRRFGFILRFWLLSVPVFLIPPRALNVARTAYHRHNARAAKAECHPPQ